MPTAKTRAVEAPRRWMTLKLEALLLHWCIVFRWDFSTVIPCERIDYYLLYGVLLYSCRQPASKPYPNLVYSQRTTVIVCKRHRANPPSLTPSPPVPLLRMSI